DNRRDIYPSEIGQRRAATRRPAIRPSGFRRGLLHHWRRVTGRRIPHEAPRFVSPPMSQPDPLESPKTPRPHWTVASVALFVIGLLILMPSGLCSAWALTY